MNEKNPRVSPSGPAVRGARGLAHRVLFVYAVSGTVRAISRPRSRSTTSTSSKKRKTSPCSRSTKQPPRPTTPIPIWKTDSPPTRWTWSANSCGSETKTIYSTKRSGRRPRRYERAAGLQCSRHESNTLPGNAILPTVPARVYKLQTTARWNRFTVRG